MIDKGQWLIVALLFVPVPLVFVIALLRGYTITLHFRKGRRRGDDE